MQDASRRSHEDELSPEVHELAEDFRRRLGTLDPQQVAIWREMTPESKIHLAFQMYDLARRIIWTTESQWHPDALPDELYWRMLRRLHGTEFCTSLRTSMRQDRISLADLVSR
jgi:hypothetical protein